MKQRFVGQVAWITGGGSGIGRALAVELARQGADVAVSGRRVDRLSEAVEAIEATGRRGLAVACDVTDEAAVERAVAEVVGTLGRLDVAIANAGFSVAGTVADLTAEDWRRQLNTNVVGAAMTVRHALPHLEANRGRVVLVGSVSAFVHPRKMAAYSASKAAIRALGETLLLELAGKGVSCTTVHPGYIESEIAQVDNDGVFHADREDKRPRNLMWSADRAARVVLDAVWARRGEFVFTGHGRVAAFLGRHLPGVARRVVG